MKGQRLSLGWLAETSVELTDEPDEKTVEYVARAWIL